MSKYKSGYKDAYPFRVGMNKAKSVTKYGLKRFGEGISDGASFVMLVLTKILNKICATGVVIFGIATVFNIITMGFGFGILHTKSFLLLVGSLAVGALSYIIEGIVG